MTLLVTLLAVAAPAGAGPQAGVWESARIDWVAGWDEGSQSGSFRIERDPDGILHAEAFYDFCEIDACTHHAFAPQIVSDGVLSMDAIGNAAAIDVCLVELDDGCERFSFVLRRPSATFLSPCCTPNLWYDPDTGEVGLGTDAGTELVRTGYFVDAEGSSVGFNSDVAGVSSSTHRFVGLHGSEALP